MAAATPIFGPVVAVSEEPGTAVGCPISAKSSDSPACDKLHIDYVEEVRYIHFGSIRPRGGDMLEN
jgi:hypothetical protein